MPTFDFANMTLILHLTQFYESSSSWQVFERVVYWPFCAALFLFNVVRIYNDYKFCKRYKTDRRPLYKRPKFVINSLMMSIPYIHVWWLMFVAIVLTWNYMFDPD